MRALTTWTLANKRLVVIMWLIVAAISLIATGPASNSLTSTMTLPGQPGYETNQAILSSFGNGGRDAPIVPVITLPPGVTVDSAGVRAELAAALAGVQQAVPKARIVSYASTGSNLFVSADRRTTFALVYPAVGQAGGGHMGGVSVTQDAAQRILGAVQIDGTSFHITGRDALQTSSSSGGMSAMSMTMIGILGALIVLALVFGSLLAVVPIVMAILAIGTTFVLVWALTRVTDVSTVVQYVVALIGLGIAIDYSLLVVMRWREERARGLDNADAVRRAMETAGKSVVFSGTTVAVGMLALVVLPVPFLRSIGVGGLLIPLVSVLVATTLLPVMLATIGPRLEWPLKGNAHPSRFWGAWAGAIVRQRWLAAGAAIAVLSLMAIPAFSITLGTPRADALTKSGDAYIGLQALEHAGIGPGALSPYEVLVQGTSAQLIAGRLEQVNGVRGALAPSVSGWHDGPSSLVVALPSTDGASASGRAALDGVRREAKDLPGVVRVGGVDAENVDFVSAVYGNFPLTAVLLAAVTFLLLTRAFRSPLLALKAVLLAATSVGVAWGLMTFVWQDGHGSQLFWGVPGGGALEAFIPLVVFAFLFGISMDYEVFLLSRMREEYETTGSTRSAVVRGMASTGRLVTSAALILFLAFASLSSAPSVMVKTFATGLAAGILVDATVIRMLLVPALVSLFGPWNWWLPSRLARVLRMQPTQPAATTPDTVERRAG